MQDGRILNSAITASSYYRRRSAPNRARLHMALPDKYISGGFTGGWCQYPSSKYQWLQVDFGFIARVGKVATQGKQEFNFWVTKYFLAYKRDSKRKRLLYRQHGNVQVGRLRCVVVFGRRNDLRLCSLISCKTSQSFWSHQSLRGNSAFDLITE